MNKLRLLSEKSESDFSERTSAASRLASLFVVGRGLGHSSFLLYGIGMDSYLIFVIFFTLALFEV